MTIFIISKNIDQGHCNDNIIIKKYRLAKRDTNTHAYVIHKYDRFISKL